MKTIIVSLFAFFYSVFVYSQDTIKPKNIVKANLSEFFIPLNAVLGFEFKKGKFKNFEIEAGYCSSRIELLLLYGGSDYIFVKDFINNGNVFFVFYESVLTKISYKLYYGRSVKSLEKNKYISLQFLCKYSFFQSDSLRTGAPGEHNFRIYYNASSHDNVFGLSILNGAIYENTPYFELYWGFGARYYYRQYRYDGRIENDEILKPTVHFGLKIGLGV